MALRQVRSHAEATSAGQAGSPGTRPVFEATSPRSIAASGSWGPTAEEDQLQGALACGRGLGLSRRQRPAGPSL